MSPRFRKPYLTPFLVLFHGANAWGAGGELRVEPDRPNGIYEPDQVARFTIEAKVDGMPLEEGKVRCRFTLDNVKELKQQTSLISKGRAVCAHTLAKPGVLRLSVSPSLSGGGPQLPTADAPLRPCCPGWGTSVVSQKGGVAVGHASLIEGPKRAPNAPPAASMPPILPSTSRPTCSWGLA